MLNPIRNQLRSHGLLTKNCNRYELERQIFQLVFLSSEAL